VTPFNDRFQLYAADLAMTADAAYALDPSGDMFRAWNKARWLEWCELEKVDPNGTMDSREVGAFERWLERRGN
jgi:hypothetical protein